MNYRHQIAASNRKPGRLVLIAGLAILVLLLAVYLAAAAVKVAPAAGPIGLRIEAITEQCHWTFDYIQHGVRSDELVLPVGQPARISITSLDELRIFSVPERKLKGSARPRSWTELVIKPQEIEEYFLSEDTNCKGRTLPGNRLVRVVEPMAFHSWAAVQPTSPRPTPVISEVEKGQFLVETSGCLGCHSVDGSELVGPSLRGLFATQRKLEDGSTVLADAAYLVTAIREPGAQVPEGYPNIMPPAFTILSDAEIQAMITYMASLK